MRDAQALATAIFLDLVNQSEWGLAFFVQCPLPPMALHCAPLKHTLALQ